MATQVVVAGIFVQGECQKPWAEVVVVKVVGILGCWVYGSLENGQAMMQARLVMIRASQPAARAWSVRGQPQISVI